MQVQNPGRGTKVLPYCVAQPKEKKEGPHAHPTHCASPCVWNQDQSSWCAVLPAQLTLIPPLIIKLPNSLLADLILSHWKGLYSHNTNTSHRDEPWLAGLGHQASPTSPPIQGPDAEPGSGTPSQPEFLLGIYLTGVGEKETLFFFPLRRKGIDICKPTVILSHHGFNVMGRDVPREWSQHRERPRHRDREEDRQPTVLDPAAPEAVAENELCSSIHSLTLFG